MRKKRLKNSKIYLDFNFATLTGSTFFIFFKKVKFVVLWRTASLRSAPQAAHIKPVYVVVDNCTL
jgi:hypothetical protein